MRPAPRLSAGRTLNAIPAAMFYLAGFSYEGLEYTGTVPISRPASLIMAMRRSGSSSGLSSETPMASTVALIIASVSSSQTKPDASKSLWPFLTSKK